MNLNFMKAFNENFAIKVFVKLAVFIVTIYCCLSIFFIHNQRKTLTDSLIHKGHLLVGILAHNSRIGVFSENLELLNAPADGVFQQDAVLQVIICNLEGKVLKKLERPGTYWPEKQTTADRKNNRHLFADLKQAGSSVLRENRDTFEFWKPVMTGLHYMQEEALFFRDEYLQRRNRIIGFVGITVDKKILSKQLNDLLFQSILIGTLFLLLSAGVAYLVSRGITRPLNRLTDGVKALGKGSTVDMLPVETDDEIGKLAQAFNAMTQSLQAREVELRKSEERLRVLSSKLLQAQEEERKRLAIELHDELGQDLALLKLRLRSITRKLAEHQAALIKDCQETSRYVDEIIENVRRLSRDLSPSVLKDLGLTAALRWQVENFAKQHSFKISLDVQDIDHLFSEDVQINLYRIFQETLTNIVKHALAKNIFITVEQQNRQIVFVVEDDGKGFDLNGLISRGAADKGMGLATMRERSYMVGGTCDVWSKPDRGTRITLTVPIENTGGSI